MRNSTHEQLILEDAASGQYLKREAIAFLRYFLMKIIIFRPPLI